MSRASWDLQKGPTPYMHNMPIQTGIPRQDLAAVLPQQSTAPSEFSSVGAVESMTHRVAESALRVRAFTDRLARCRQMLRTGSEAETPGNKPDGQIVGVPALQGLDLAVSALEAEIGALGKECDQL